MATRFILRLRLSTEHRYAFKPSPCLKRVEFPLNEQIFNTIGIIPLMFVVQRWLELVQIFKSFTKT
ncbi:hypothetical protein SIL85_06390 [Shewanella oneidensis]|uniref:hypothetical protein n=1 Tax=Shewanella oneidensis TaxID=70863 RepID=UPI001EE71077|nr:hypothetical protein [Shewanella oneidensis]MDX5996689.1 hypothetical protein [Shewanella oneidensis]